MAVADRLAVVERFQSGQLFVVLLDQVGELVEQSAALAGVHLPPGAFLERLAGGLDGHVDVGLVPLGDLAMTSPVAGLSVSKVLPLTESTHLPSMSILVWRILTSRAVVRAGAVAVVMSNSSYA